MRALRQRPRRAVRRPESISAATLLALVIFVLGILWNPLSAGADGKTAKAIPFGFVLPAFALRQLVDLPCFHRHGRSFCPRHERTTAARKVRCRIRSSNILDTRIRFQRNEFE